MTHTEISLKENEIKIEKKQKRFFLKKNYWPQFKTFFSFFSTPHFFGTFMTLSKPCEQKFSHFLFYFPSLNVRKMWVKGVTKRVDGSFLLLLLQLSSPIFKLFFF